MEFMNNFEATLLISPDLTVKKIESIEKFFEKNVKSLGGSIIAKENWGLRDLSYKINNAKKALYRFYHITFYLMIIQFCNIFNIFFNIFPIFVHYFINHYSTTNCN